jgi:hypothetical protein
MSVRGENSFWRWRSESGGADKNGGFFLTAAA